MNTRLPTLLFFLLLLLLSPAAQAQELSYRNYQVRDGLPSSEVYCAFQDHFGYMWFSTDAGICRFDGYSFKTYTTKEGLTDNTVFDLFEDRHGRIWCKTLSGKICYLENEHFYTIPATDSIAALSGAQIASSIYVDEQDTLWLGVDYIGILKVAPGYTVKDIQVVRPRDCHLAFFVNRHGGVQAMIKKMPGRNIQLELKTIWEKKTENVIKIPFITNLNILRLWVVGEQHFFVSQGNQILELDHGRFIAGYNCSSSVLSLHVDRSQTLWVGLYDGGILCFRKSNLADRPLHYFGTEPISSIGEDHEGGIWLASLKNGIYYLTNDKVVNYAEYGIVPDNKIFSIVKVGESVWAGNNNGTIWAINEKGMRILDFPEVNKLKDNAVMTIKQVGSAVLVGARHSFIIDTAGKMLRKQMDEDASSIVKYYASENDCTITAGAFSILYKLDIATGILKERTFFEKSRIVSCYAGLGDTLWLGCVNGLWCRTGNAFHYLGAVDSLLRHRIDYISSADGKTLYFATKDAGVLIWDRKKIKRISASDGLASDFCRHILLGKNEFWVATNQGVSRVKMNGDHYTITNVGIEEGLVSNEVNQLCFMNDKLWVATSRGVSAFDTATVFLNATPPPIYLGRIYVEGKEQQQPDPRLRYNENTIVFSFTGLAFRNAKNVSYRYRLLGLDSNWRITQTPEVRFTTLPSGDYEFEVCALNSDNIPSKVPARWKFTVAPPFWGTWWFILIAALSVFLLGGGIVYVRTRAQQKREKEKALLNQQIAGMEMKALRAQMNPHFIFNAITSIQHFVLRNDSRQANKYLTKFSRLIRNVLENSQQDTIPLRQEADTIMLYVEIESLRFNSSFDYTFDIDPALYNSPLTVPTMLIQPFVENAIWHGLLPKPGDGRLRITIRREGDYIHCLVDDDGIGRAASAATKKAVDGHRSIGMNLTRERIEALNRLYTKKTELRIQDKLDSEGRAAGTLVELFIPIFV